MIRITFASLFLSFPAVAQTVSQADLSAMAAADIVILGEIHDNPAHHLMQAEIIAALRPTSVVFEMLSPAQATTVNAGFDDPHALAADINWADSGWPDFTYYAPIFSALGQTPVAGAAMSRAQVRDAFGAGAAAVFGEGADRFGLDQPLSLAELTTRKKMQFDAHCAAMPIEMMGGMIEAQRLRDAHFSRVALNALTTYGAPIVVIAGNGHARRDWGMPAMIAQAVPTTDVFALGLVETPAPTADPRFTLTLATDPAARPDPCDAFKKS